ncbi:MAG TPA: ABC transporter permease [Spirochaetia bacterium]
MNGVQAIWQRFWAKSGGFSIKKYGLMIGFLVIGVVISIITPSFLTVTNLLNILRQSSIVGVMAIGTAFVIIGGGFDISVGSVLALTAAMSLKMQEVMPWYLVIVVVLAVGCLIGLLNGVLTAKVHIVAIITTLGTMTIVRGLTYLYTGGYPITGSSPEFQFIGSGYIGPVPFPIIVFLVMVILWQFVLKRTTLGRYSCAVGGNKEATRLSGVPVDFYHIMTFVIGGLMAAMSGIIYAARLNSATPLAGQGYEMDAIASCVIGGTSVSGGEGSIIGILIGVLLLNVVNNMFNLLGIQVYVQYLIKGVIILTVVGFDSYSRHGR